MPAPIKNELDLNNLGSKVWLPDEDSSFSSEGSVADLGDVAFAGFVSLFGEGLEGKEDCVGCDV